MQFHRVPTNVQKQRKYISFMDTQQSDFFGKHVFETSPSKFDERLFSDIYLCRLRLKQGREMQDFMFCG